MDKMYKEANDKHVGAFIVYGKTSDKKLYLDKALKAGNLVNFEDAKRAFECGILKIVVGTDVFEPVAIVGGKIITVTSASGSVSGVEWAAAN